MYENWAHLYQYEQSVHSGRGFIHRKSKRLHDFICLLTFVTAKGRKPHRRAELPDASPKGEELPQLGKS